MSEAVLLSCMAYVDLNPVRIKVASTPEQSCHTRIKERINPSVDLSKAIEKQNGILFSLIDYLELVDYTGRIIRPD